MKIAIFILDSLEKTKKIIWEFTFFKREVSTMAILRTIKEKA